MQNDQNEKQFNTILTLVGLALLVIAVIFSFLNTRLNLKVSGASIRGGNASADIVKNKIEIRFNRPLKEIQSKDQISISPNVDFDYLQSGPYLFISFPSNLAYETRYTLTVGKGIQDTFNSTLESPFTYSFTTRPAKIFYIDKNIKLKQDSIWASDLKFENKSIAYKGGDIINYDARGDLVGVIERQGNANSVQIYNYATREALKRNILGDDKTAYKIKFNADGTEAYILADDLENHSNSLKIPKGRGLIYIYNIEKETISSLDMSKDISNIVDFDLSIDGNLLLVKDGFTFFYYLIDSTTPEQSLNLGKFHDSGGFGQGGRKVVFSTSQEIGSEEKGKITILDAQSEQNYIKADTLLISTPILFNNTPRAAFTEQFKPIADYISMSRLVIYGIEQEDRVEIECGDLSCELPKISPDDNYFLIEGFSADELKNPGLNRVVNSQLKPATSRLLLYDVRKQFVFDTGVRGIDPIWD